MNSLENLSKQILEFVNTQTDRKNLTPESRLYEDLRMDGDDADDFFIAFEQHFDVNLEGLDLGNYFNEEGFDPIGLSNLIKKALGRKSAKKQHLGPITLGHLVEVVKRGGWFDPSQD